MSVLEKPWYTSMIVSFLERDIPGAVGLPPSAFARDILTLERRVSTEGESFLTKTLPQLGKSIDFALQERSPLAVSGFCKRKRRSALPAFLQALLRRVFSDDGVVLGAPCITSIKALRQICYWCKKVEKGFTDESLQRSVREFVSLDQDLPEVSMVTNPRLLGTAQAIVTRIFRGFGNLEDFRPAHGPGTVAWSVGENKFRLDRAYDRLESVFRPIPFFFSLRDASENPQRVTSRIHTEYGLSRLAFVEKDSSGPRLIGLEPAEYMWCQQALKRAMYDHIEKRSLAKGRINFTDQSVNRQLTKDWNQYDTLDMSSASDRNSLSLVTLLFAKTHLLRYLLASRTPGVVLPDQSVLLYKKFAPMGSAVCFPVEAVVFYALAVSSLVSQGVPLLIALRKTYVYGDDVIVPHGFYAQMEKDFESVGLKFSSSKCCISGKFRESCGLDSYDSQDVTPVRLRRPHFLKQSLDYPSIVAHANELTKKGYWNAADALRKAAMRLPRFQSWARVIPFSDRTDLPILTWLSYTKKSTVKFVYKSSMCYVKGLVFKPCRFTPRAALERCLLRVSLSSQGPVGDLVRRGSGIRVLTERFRGFHTMKKVCISDGSVRTVREAEASFKSKQ